MQHWCHSMRSIRFFTLVLAIIVCSALVSVSSAAEDGWTALHPGGGGQIQGLVLDPSVSGRVYSLSDVDGVYRSNDGGESYESLNSGLHTDAALGLAINPKNSNHLLLGTARGVLRSTNGGTTWTPVAGTTEAPGGDNDAKLGLPVAALAYDPVTPKRAYFANSWLFKDTYSFYWNQLGFNNTSDIKHPGRMYRTEDGGTTWKVVTFEPTASYMNVYNIAVNPAAHNEVYIAAHAGLYKSTNYGASWTKLAAPSGGYHPRGVEVTPDGAFLLTTWTTEQKPEYDGDGSGSSPSNPNTSFWTTPVLAKAQVSWQRRDSGLPQPDKSQGGNPAPEYWRPTVDPRDTSGSYHVLLGTLNGRQGLYEAIFTRNGNTLTTTGWQRVLWTSGSEGWQYDQGWDAVSPVVRFYQYTPTSWSQRQVWASGGQTILRGDPTSTDWPKRAWTERYTKKHGVYKPGDYKRYQTRGIQSTVTYDQAALRGYVAQAQADNGLLESFDGGVTWTEEHRPASSQGQAYTNARAVHIFARVDPPIVLTAAGPGFGGGGATRVHAMQLQTFSSADTWRVNVDKGLPTNDYASSIAEANDGKGVYISFEGARGRDGGVYYHPDVQQLANGNGQFEQILAAGRIYKVQPDPRDDNRLFWLDGKVLYRVQRSGTTWTPTKIDGAVEDFAVWVNSGKTYVAYGARDTLYLSDDAGTTSKAVWTLDSGSLDDWNTWLYVEKEPEVAGIVGYKNQVFFGVGLFKNRKSIGFYRATISGSGANLSVNAQNWTGSGAGRLENTRLRSAEILNISGTRYVGVTTSGSGLWARPLPQ